MKKSKKLRKKYVILGILLLCIPIVHATLDENAEMDIFPSSHMVDDEWSNTYGGINIDGAEDVKSTNEGNYIIAGKTKSYGNGERDVWLIKTDENGTEIWNKTYGGKEEDVANSVDQASDGGYIIGGYTESYQSKNADFFLIKTDGIGNELWSRTYGGRGNDFGKNVIQTKDGGYIVIGVTYSYGRGMGDLWLIKTDENGEMLWNKTYGGPEEEWGHDVIQASGDGYVLIGFTESYGEGKWDIWLIKTNEEGDELWNRTYGDIGMDIGICIEQTSDNGYIIAGASNSYASGEWLDIILLKTDEKGNEKWMRVYGGSDEDNPVSVAETPDGYVIIGTTGSYGVGYFDAWIIKVDKEGDELWNKTFGTRNREVARSGIFDNGCYVVTGEKSKYGDSDPDVWLIKCTDYSPPNITIMRPRERYLYLFDREIIYVGKTWIVGSIKVSTRVYDASIGISRVEFYLSGFDYFEYDPKAIVYTPPYEWRWNTPAIGIMHPYTVTAGAYYGNAGGVAVDKIDVRIFNP